MEWRRISAAEPVLVPVEELRSFLHLNHNDDDVQLAGLERTARHYIEDTLQSSLLNQHWERNVSAREKEKSTGSDGRLGRMIDERTGGQTWHFAFGPVQSLLSVLLIDKDGNETPLALEKAVLQAGLSAVDIHLYPPPARSTERIKFQVQAGYGASPAQVPPQLVHAVKALAAHLYERPFAVNHLKQPVLPAAVQMAIAPYYRMHL